MNTRKTIDTARLHVADALRDLGANPGPAACRQAASRLEEAARMLRRAERLLARVAP